MHDPTQVRTTIGLLSRGATLHALRRLLFAAVFLALAAEAHASGPGEEPRSPAPAQESASEESSAIAGATDARPRREFFGFATDAAVARGLWAELGEVYQQSSSRFSTFATVAYGWRAWEFGGDASVTSSGAFHNLGFWAKYVGWKLGTSDVGAGVLTEGPTTKDDDFDVAPFATASLPVGQWDLRSSLGYVITKGFFYDAACLRPLGELADFRAELSGSFDDGFEQHVVQLVPGLDVHFAVGDWPVLVRVSAGAELHPSPNAVVGLSFALTAI